MRQKVVAFVEQLEAGPRDPITIRTANGEGGDQLPERFDDVEHQTEGHLGESCELWLSLLGVGEVAGEDLQEHFVAHVE